MPYTPGPWVVSATIGDYTAKSKVFVLGVAISPATEHPVLIAEIPRHRPGSADRIAVHQEEWEANARLVAAAPELLDALRDIEARLQDAGDEQDRILRARWWAIDTARAAITKAEGAE